MMVTARFTMAGRPSPMRPQPDIPQRDGPRPTASQSGEFTPAQIRSARIAGFCIVVAASVLGWAVIAYGVRAMLRAVG